MARSDYYPNIRRTAQRDRQIDTLMALLDEDSFTRVFDFSVSMTLLMAKTMGEASFRNLLQDATGAENGWNPPPSPS